MLIKRYVILEIMKPLLTICAVLVIIFQGYSATRYLPAAANGMMTGTTVLTLVSLKVLIALEVLIPITLFLSVIKVLARLHAQSEVVAMQAGGLGERALLSSVFQISILVALIVSALSLYVRPWAYEKSYWVKADSEANFDFSRLRPGRFNEIGEGRLVVFLESLDANRNRAEGVFIEQRKDTGRKITRAREAWQETDPSTAEKSLVLRDGYHYELNDTNNSTKLFRFQNTRLALVPKEVESIEYRRKAATTRSLSASSAPADIAEFQWRLSTGLSTVLLGLLAVPLSRTAPRRRKSTNIFMGVVIFAIYYNMTAVAKIWVERGVVDSFPWVWWPHILLAILFLLLVRPLRSGYQPF